MDEIFFRNLASIRKKTRSFAASEVSRSLKDSKPWPVYNSTLSSYLESFRGALPEVGLTEYLQSLSEKKNRKLNALDVAGQGLALLELKEHGIGTISAITLLDHRSDARRTEETKEGLRVYEGDVTKNSTWSQLGDDKFDLITCRPEASTHSLIYTALELAVFSRIYNRLDVDGILLMQYPNKKLFEDGIKILRKIPGLIVRPGEGDMYPVLSIIKTKDAPTTLQGIFDEMAKIK